MYTGRDPYVHMEVKIIKGGLKPHHGTIIDSRELDGRRLFTVRTTTRTINEVHHLAEDEIQEL
jgi:hypothetical protein